MALSGSFQNLPNGKFGIVCNWSGVQSIANNRTTITIDVYLRYYNVDIGARSDGSYQIGSNTGTWSAVAINSMNNSSYHNTKLGTITANVNHGSDGKANNVTLKVVYPFRGTYSGTYYSSITASTTVNLDAIPRYATVTQSCSSKTETTATMKWTSDSTVDYIWYSTNNGSTWTGINVADGTSGTYTISGLSANTSYNIKTRVRRKDSQLTTDSSALAVKTYAYPYANSMPNFTIGNSVTIGIYNPLGRSVSIKMTDSSGNNMGTNTTSGTSFSGWSSTAVVNNLYGSIPNAQSGTYKIVVTYGSQVSTKTGGTYTINKSVCSPSIGTVAYQDTNSTAVGITGNNQKIVRNQSTVRYTASSLTAKNSATVSSCSVTVNGNTYNLTLSGSTATGGNASINSGTNVTAKFTVTDSRGLTATKNVTVQMLDWYLPTAIITLQRHDNFYSETDITVDADYASVNGGNQITITYKARKKGTSTYTVTGTLSDNVTSTFTADNNYEWDVVVTVKDSFNGTTTYNLFLSRGLPIIYFDRLRSSVGINCFPKEDSSLEVNGVNVSKSVMTRSLSANVTDLAVSTYTIVPLDLSISAGSKLTATNDGGIQIGANVSKVLVSGRASIVGSATTGRRHLRIMKNSYTNNNTLAWSQDDFAASVTEDIVITPTLANVQEGDVIYLWYYVPNTADTLGGNAYGARTSMTVETVE